MCFVQIVLVLLAITPILSIETSESETQKWVQVGEPTNFSCTDAYPENCHFCRIQRMDAKGVPEIELQCTQTTANNWTSYAPVADCKGQCGLIIHSVDQDDIAVWRLMVTSGNEANPYFNCTIRLLVATKPSQPSISEIENFFENGNNTVDVKCCSEGGTPFPDLGLVYDGAAVENTTVERVNDTEPYKICITWSQASFTWEDDAKEVTCIQNHVLYDGSTHNDSKNIVVLHAPKLINADNMTYEYDISSNPAPEISTIYGFNIQILQKSVSANIWKLTVLPDYEILTQTEHNIDVDVRNPHGNMSLAIKIGALTTPIPPTIIVPMTTPVPATTTTSKTPTTANKPTLPTTPDEEKSVPVAIYAVLAFVLGIVICSLVLYGVRCYNGKPVRSGTPVVEFQRNILGINHATE